MSQLTEALEIDPKAESERIIATLRESVHRVMRRRGAVVGISGGVDSSVVLALSVKAFGPERVAAIMMPERESAADTERLSRSVARHFGVEPILEDMTPALDGFGCYRRRDEAIRRLFPEYDPRAGYKAKIALPPGLLERDDLNVFVLTVIAPAGKTSSRQLPLEEYLQIVAASNFKQRSRMAMLYYHAEVRHFAVVGTANKNEHEQGFFVKFGDGGVDIRPIAHLFKTQVYRLAEYLNVPEEIRQRPPTTDTYSAAGTQEEFFFRLPFPLLDALWSAQERNVPIDTVAAEAGLTVEQIRRVFRDLDRKRRTTEYLRLAPVALDPA
jgi:NAD+ synthase